MMFSGIGHSRKVNPTKHHLIVYYKTCTSNMYFLYMQLHVLDNLYNYYSAHNIKWDCHFEIYFFSRRT